MAITGYDYNYTGDGRVTTVDIPGIASDNIFTGTQSFSGNLNSSSKTTGTVRITGGLGVTEGIMADSVWGVVWNDLADCLVVPDDVELEPGFAYCFDGKEYYKSDKYLADGFIGIHSDTAGFKMGYQKNKNQFNVGVAGFILVYVDKEYEPGTPLTITADGRLTSIRDEDIIRYPNKIVGTFWKKEPKEKWGPEGEEVEVKGRYWIKVK